MMEALHWLAEHPFSALVWMVLTVLAVLVASWLIVKYIECWQESRIFLVVAGGLFALVAMFVGAGSGGGSSGGGSGEPYRDKLNEEMAKNAQIVHAKRTGLIP